MRRKFAIDFDLSDNYWYGYSNIALYLNSYITTYIQKINKDLLFLKICPINDENLPFEQVNRYNPQFESSFDQLKRLPKEVKMKMHSEIDELNALKDTSIIKDWHEKSVLMSIYPMQSIAISDIIEACKAAPKRILLPVYLGRNHFSSIIIERVSEKEYNFIGFDPLCVSTYQEELTKYYNTICKDMPDIKFNLVLNTRKVQNDGCSCGPFAVEFIKKAIDIIIKGGNVIDTFNEENGWCGMAQILQTAEDKSRIREEQEIDFYKCYLAEEPRVDQLFSQVLYELDIYELGLDSVASSGAPASESTKTAPPSEFGERTIRGRVDAESTPELKVNTGVKDNFFDKYKLIIISIGVNMAIISTIMTIKLSPEVFDIVQKIYNNFNFTADLMDVLDIIIPSSILTAALIITSACVYSFEIQAKI